MTPRTVRVLVATPGLQDRHVERIRAVSTRLEVVFEPAVPVALLASRLRANAPVQALLADGLPDPWHADGILEWVQSASTGLDQELASPIWRNSAVTVTTASGVYGPAISQWVLAVILHHAQQLNRVFAFKASRKWPAAATLVGTMVAGQTLGIVGYGSIGRECARLGRALGMHVLATRSGGIAGERSASFVPEVLKLRAPLAEPVTVLAPADIDRLLAESDYLVLAAPLTPRTHGLIDARALERMKPSAFLINVSRGPLVDEIALAAALRSGALAGAALDVFAHEPLAPESPLFDVSNLLLTPHVSGAFHGLWDLVVELFCENLGRYLSNRPLLNIARRERGY